MNDRNDAEMGPDHGFPVVPATLDAALDPEWLGTALAGTGLVGPIRAVRPVEVIRTVATKVRFTIDDGADASPRAYCLKGFLDVDELTARGGPTNVLEADFYDRVAPSLSLRTASRVVTVVDRERAQAVTIMRDLVAEGASFCSALEPFGADQASASLEQLARLHAARHLLADRPWIKARIPSLARLSHMTPDELQQLLDGPRGDDLPSATRDAGSLLAAMQRLGEQDAKRPQTLVHGDAHAGNIFRTADGPGLIDWQLLQSGSWVLDVAYHVNSVCDVNTAEREERRLLDHYLDFARGIGSEVPDRESAWTAYRGAVTYGYFLWAITRRVDPTITVVFNNRLGNAVTRHASYGLLAG